jgi:ankyrin repeat protein
MVGNDRQAALVRAIVPNSETGEGQTKKLLASMAEMWIPEQYRGEYSLKLNQLFGPSCKYLDAQAEDFILCFMVNNTLDIQGVYNILEHILNHESKIRLQSLFQMKTPAVEAISKRFLEAIATYGTERTLQALINADIDKCHLAGSLGGRLLRMAVSWRQTGVAKLLVQSGADLNHPPLPRQPRTTALEDAIISGNDDIVELLLNAGLKIDESSCESLVSLAVYHQNINIIDRLLIAGAKVDSCKAGNVNAVESAFATNMTS